jgi:hypothetical protein
VRREYSCIWEISHEQKGGSDKLHGPSENDHGQAMTGAVYEGSGKDLGDNRNSLNAERVGVDSGLREASFVVFEPEEKHALEGESFGHGTDDRKGRENIS